MGASSTGKDAEVERELWHQHRSLVVGVSDGLERKEEKTHRVRAHIDDGGKISLILDTEE